MSWGGGWGDRTPEYARELAKKFWKGEAGKKVWKEDRYERGARVKDGEYWLFGFLIARCAPDLAANAAAALVSEQYVPDGFAFTFAGWPSKTTARHLSALGLRAEVYGINSPECWIDGRRVDPSKWYTKQSLLACPSREEILEAQRQKRLARLAKRFENRTLPLFPELVSPRASHAHA